MGIPVVRLVGSGVSLRFAGAGRPRIRQGTTRTVSSRVVHEPQRPDSGLRMEFLRRKSASAGLGSLARLQNCGTGRGGRGPEFSGTGVSETPAEFHLVGESQGSGRQKRF